MKFSMFRCALKSDSFIILYICTSCVNSFLQQKSRNFQKISALLFGLD